MQTAYLGAGSYEIVPQLPSLMLRDGTVLAAGDAVARDYGEGSSAADDLEIAYAAIDARDLSEDELRAVADCSFVLRGRCERGVRARFGAEERGGGP